MKRRIISLVVLIVFYTSSNAQNPYIINNTLDKFEGIWLWTSGNDTVKLCLRKEKVLTDPQNNHFIDLIIGFHIYKTGNLVIENSYSLKDTPPSSTNRSIVANNLNGGDVLNGLLRDLFKGKTVSLELSINVTHTTLTWHSSYVGGTTANQIPGFTLPQDMVLIKQ